MLSMFKGTYKRPVTGTVERIGIIADPDANTRYVLLLEGDPETYFLGTPYGEKMMTSRDDPTRQIRFDWALTAPGDSVELMYEPGDKGKMGWLFGFRNLTLEARSASLTGTSDQG